MFFFKVIRKTEEKKCHQSCLHGEDSPKRSEIS